MSGIMYDNETETAPEQPKPKRKSRRGPLSWLGLVIAAAVLFLVFQAGTIRGRLTAEPIYKPAPNAAWITHALDVAWISCTKGAAIPPATKADGDQGACWRVEEFDIDDTPIGLVQAWRYLNRYGDVEWAWMPEGEGLCAELK